ncbi:MAG: hypothetical protein HONBIEJF_01421 [Fimbriimonadaceae bacterium]|nr:hypothetical protein [Fimbriimonadaceae bacterium]
MLKNSNWLVAGFALTALALPLTITWSFAQESRAVPPAQERQGITPGPARPFQGQFPQAGGPGVPMAPMPPMGPGQSTMIVDGGYLYILQGQRLLKVNKNDLRVDREAMLPPMRGQIEPPRPAQDRRPTPAAPGGDGIRSKEEAKPSK